MRLTRTLDLSAPVEQVYAVYVDPAFQDATGAATSTGRYTATVTPNGAGAVVRTERRLPTDGLPDFARSFVGAELVIVEVTTWAGADADGSRRGALDLQVAGTPLTLKGSITLAPSGSGTALTLDGDLRANVPFIGGRIEQAASVPLLAGLDIQLGLLKERLATS